MNGNSEMIASLSDAGLKSDEIGKAEKLLEAGSGEELVRYLRLCRCGLMDDLHETQRRVDRLDYVIRQTRKILEEKTAKGSRK